MESLESITGRCTITVDQLFQSPVAQLVHEMDIRVIESSITDATFYGGAHIGNGRTTLLLPPGRSELERDYVTRYLIAESLNLDISPLPKPFDVEFSDFTEQARNTLVEELAHRVDGQAARP
ncbi:hypothetical protein [Streptomyces sp. NPDC002666]